MARRLLTYRAICREERVTDAHPDEKRRNAMRKALFVICLSVVAALVAAGPAAAGTTFSNIKVTATCALSGQILNVDVGFTYSDLLRPKPKAVPGVPPVFLFETITLEKHVPGQNDWVPIATLFNQAPSDPSEPEDISVLLCDKTRIVPEPSVAIDPFSGFGDANALRVTVDMLVSNANDRNLFDQHFFARCLSFPPPSCP